MRLPSLSGRIPKPSDSGMMPRPGAAPTAHPLIGKVFLGKYEAVRFLGEGSNALVYLGRHVGDHSQLVVIKRIKDHIQQHARFRQFFDGEVQSMSKFRHPYAVGLHAASLDDPLGPCLVLDFIPGVTLDVALGKVWRFSVERMAILIGPLLHALHAAQQAHVVHRDLKPANLMVTNFESPSESIRVMDFGFAGFASKPHIQLAELTGHGQVFACGTPAYVSPEMVRGDAVDPRGDLYSVGVIMYEMLAGRLPFEHPTTEELLAAHLQQPPPRFGRVGVPGIPAAVEGVVQIALSKYPSERHPGAKEMALQLSRAVGFDVWEATMPPAAAKSRKPGSDDDIVVCTLADGDSKPRPASESDKFVLSDQFEAMLPERLAAVKLRGFIEDVNGLAIASEPGFIRVRLELPPGWKEPSAPPNASKSGLVNFFSSLRVPTVSRGKEPIEVDLQMQKVDSNRVAVLVAFRPLPWYLPDDTRAWNERCEGYYSILRKYLMAGD
jgi:serine/threonine protein kinase